MVLLLDIALALMVLAGALFLGAAAVGIYKEASKDKKDEK